MVVVVVVVVAVMINSDPGVRARVERSLVPRICSHGFCLSFPCNFH